MKKVTIIILCLTFTGGISNVSYASDWDKAGKVFAIIEGMRVLTGGKVDVIGNVTGINNQATYVPRKIQKKHKPRPRQRYVYHKHRGRDCFDRVWVPHYKYTKKYIPKHEDHHKRYGQIIVDGHYIRYKVESGGHWETRDYCY